MKDKVTKPDAPKKRANPVLTPYAEPPCPCCTTTEPEWKVIHTETRPNGKWQNVRCSKCGRLAWLPPYRIPYRPSAIRL